MHMEMMNNKFRYLAPLSELGVSKKIKKLIK